MQKKATTSEWEGLPGLVGTLSIRFVDASGNILIAQTTAGVRDETGNGGYTYTYTEPTVGYNWIWDDGTDQDIGPFIVPEIVTAPGTTTVAQPSSTKITQTFTIGTPPALTDMQSVVFADAANAIGVQRTDTGANVVPPGTALTRDSLGTYSYTFTDPAFGLTYTYSVKFVTPSGSTQYITGTKTGGSGATAGYYTTQALIEQRAGAYNADLWSNRGDGSSPAADPVGFADVMATVDSFINRLARKNDYVSPIPTTSADWPYLQDVATDYAMALLYIKSRGVHDDDPTSLGLAKLATDSEQKLRDLFEEGIDAAANDAKPIAAIASVQVAPACGLSFAYPASRTWPWM